MTILTRISLLTLLSAAAPLTAQADTDLRSLLTERYLTSDGFAHVDVDALRAALDKDRSVDPTGELKQAISMLDICRGDELGEDPVLTTIDALDDEARATFDRLALQGTLGEISPYVLVKDQTLGLVQLPPAQNVRQSIIIRPAHGGLKQSELVACMQANSSVSTSQSQCEDFARLACDAANFNDSCIGSSVGWIQQEDPDPGSVRRSEVIASGVVVDREGQIALSAGHVRDEGLFSANLTPSYLFSDLADGQVAITAVAKASRPLTNIDLTVVLLDGQYQWTHQILRHGTDIPEGTLLNVGYGQIARCNDGVLDGGRKTGTRSVTPYDLRLATPPDQTSFLARTKALVGAATYGCESDSGSGLYLMTKDGAPVVVGLLSRAATEQEGAQACGMLNRFVDLTNPEVQDAILDAVIKLLDGQVTRTELKGRLFGAPK